MTKRSPFHEAKPRTPKDEAHQREIKRARAMEDLLQIRDEEIFRQRLRENFGIGPGQPKFDPILAIWREYQRGRL